MAAPRGRGGGRRGHRRRVDGENLRHVALEQGAERTARAVDPEGDDLLQVEQPLGLLGGDHPAFKFPGGAGEPPRVGGPVRVQRGHDVGRARPRRALPCAQLVAPQRRERPAVELKLALCPEVLLEEPGILRPAELVERGEDDRPDRRSWPCGADARARRAAELADQLLAPLVESAEHAGLGDKFGDGYRVIAGVLREPPGNPEGLLQCAGEFIADSGQAHDRHCTPDPRDVSMAPMRLAHGLTGYRITPRGLPIPQNLGNA